MDVSKYAMLYAGAQKNAGPAGVVVRIIRDDMLEKVPANLPNLLDYKALAEENSLLNTPPCWSIYIVGLVLKWVKGLGGLEAVQQRNQDQGRLGLRDNRWKRWFLQGTCQG